MLLTTFQGCYNKKSKNNLEKIKEMKGELLRLGYKLREVDCIIRIAGDGLPFKNLNDNQIATVEAVLEKQLMIARNYFGFPKIG